MIKKVALYFMIFIVFSLLTVAIFGFTGKEQSSDVIVVLGNKVLDNQQPSPRLARRLDSAVIAYTNGVSDKVLVSGGIDPSGNNEAEIMANYLIDRGININNIYLDEIGNNTLATARNTKLFLEENGLKTIFIVSHFYHLLRVELIMDLFNIEVNGSKAAVYKFDPRDIYSTFREVPAIAKFLIQKYLTNSIKFG